MKFLNGLFGRSANDNNLSVSTRKLGVEVDNGDMSIIEAARSRVDANGFVQNKFDASEDGIEPAEIDDVSLSSVESVIDSVGKARPATVNIWDLDGEETPAAAPAPERTSSRARRNRTRILGFDAAESPMPDIFDESEANAPATAQVVFPVGWVLIVSGPGRGHCFALTPGMTQIGRGEDQGIRLDFGDTAISRNNHAAIVYDPKSKKFLLGHGGKSNIVRLNDNPVISNEELNDGDKISLGETILQLKTLCGAHFDWSETDDGEEHDDVAIA